MTKKEIVELSQIGIAAADQCDPSVDPVYRAIAAVISMIAAREAQNARRIIEGQNDLADAGHAIVLGKKPCAN